MKVADGVFVHKQSTGQRPPATHDSGEANPLLREGGEFPGVYPRTFSEPGGMWRAVLVFRMTIRNRMSIIMLVVAGLLIAAGDKFAGMILLSLLLPVYGSAISSVSLFFFVAVTRFFRRPGS